MKDGKLLLSGYYNVVLPLTGNDEVCAKLKLHILMLENSEEETEGTLPCATNASMLSLFCQVE